MDNPAQSHLKELASHLDSAKNLVAQLGNGPALTLIHSATPEPSELSARYRAAEKRANEAEIALSKLSAEIESVKKQAQASMREVQRLAYQDPLTGLANAHLIHQHLDNLPRRPGREIVMLLLDLDRFAVVNQMLGHDCGDVLLKQVSERLNQIAGGSLAVARLGEDEFAVVLSDVPSGEVESRTGMLAEAVGGALSEPYLVGGQKLDLTFSFGASFMPGRAADSQELQRQADLALSHVKRSGRARFALFDEALHKGMQRDSMMEFQLRHALEAGEFFLEYLPFVWLEEKGKRGWEARLIGAEALVRWRHRVEGVLSPHEFLPMAERTGLIVPLGEWVIQQACRQLKEWTEAGIGTFINVNLYARQLLQPGLLETVRAAVQEAGVAPSALSFELTESVANLDNARIDEALASLCAEGFSIAIDNFGEGFFSLARMAGARFLKLSRAVVGGDVELCRKAVAVANGMELIPVGIGVETPEQARFLAHYGCLMLQGYYFSPPKPAQQMAELFRAGTTWKV